MTNIDFVNFCKAALTKYTRYMWGTYGQPISDKLIASKVVQYPTHYDMTYQTELREAIKNGGIACDCTGLIKWFLWTDGDISKPPKYNEDTDNSASGWYRTAKIKGEIDTLPLKRQGLILWKQGHCGVYVGDGQVIECTKGTFGNGVVQTKLNDRQWTDWCECAYIDYVEDKPEEEHRDVTELAFVSAHVKADCFAYADLKRNVRIGNVDRTDEIAYLGDYGSMAVIIYPTAASYKVAFIDKYLVVL